MLLKDLETLSRLISVDTQNQHSPLRGRFTAYIIRRMRWHAYRYYEKNREKVIVIPLEDIKDKLPDIQEANRQRSMELLIAFQQELPHLSEAERKTALRLLKMTCNEIAHRANSTNSNVYKTRRRIASKMDSLKGE